jgi:hypothetical protein
MTAPTPISPTTLRDLARKATPGPWEAVADLYDGKDELYGYFHGAGPALFNGKEVTPDAAYIAAANPAAILALLSRLERAEACVEAIESAVRISHDPAAGYCLRSDVTAALHAFDDPAAKAQGAEE